MNTYFTYEYLRECTRHPTATRVSQVQCREVLYHTLSRDSGPLTGVAERGPRVLAGAVSA